MEESKMNPKEKTVQQSLVATFVPREKEPHDPSNNLFIFAPQNPLRKFCVIVTTSKIFDNFILLVIVFNCIMMAIDSPLPNNDKSVMNKIVEEMEIYVLGIFIGEAVLKIISQGLILHEYAYLRNGWNILDITVVITGILGMPQIGLDAGEPMKVIKAARVLRPLKLVSGVPSLQVVMSAILRSMASLLQICLLICFVILMYGVVGLSFMIGKFHYGCFYKNSTVLYKGGVLCGEKECPDSQNLECRQYWSGPNDGITSFDNILISCLTVFVCITCEGWTDTMYWTFEVMDEHGYYVWIYYYTLNIIGSQFMLNLVCGVLSGEFSREKDRVENRKEFLRMRNERLATQRAAEHYEGWVSVGEIKKAKEDENLLKWTQEENEIEEDDNVPSRLTLWQRFKMKHGIFRSKVKQVMESSAVYWLVIILVFCNSLSGAIQHYRQPQWITDVIFISDYIFIGCFFSEMVLKLYSFGPTLYFQKKFNTFDFTVVIGGLLNLATSKLFGINFAIPVLRQLRLLRLFKYTRSWTKMKDLIKSILASMSSIMSLIVLLFLFLVIVALLGMELFGGNFREGSRTNFDDFFNSFLAVFQIITGEDWNFVLYDGVVAFGGPNTSKGLAVSLYFVGVTVLGNYVLLNVFLAIAVDNLTMAEEEDKAVAAEEQARQEHMMEVRQTHSGSKSVTYDSGAAISDQGKETERSDVDRIDGEFDIMPLEGGTFKPNEGFLENLKNPGRMTGNIHTSVGSKILEVNTLLLFSPSNPIRVLVHKIVSNAFFDNTILALILISSALLAIENTTNPDAFVNHVLTYFDYVFTSIFALEVLLKVVNYGFVFHPGSYCRDSWNCLDMFVVCCAITSLVLSKNKNTSLTVRSIVKILRILRVLRPLKSINKLPKLKAVFQCMMFSLKNVLNIIIITLQFLFIFSVMGVQLFNGKFFSCSDPSKEWEEDCQGYFIDFKDMNYNNPTEEERTWMNKDFNFDNVANAMLTLFASSTGEGWPNVMQSGIDSQAESQGPIINSKIWISVYFIVFVVIFSFFFINVFVGLIIITFQDQAAGEVGEVLDRNARNSLQFAMMAKPIERYMPDDTKGWQYKAWVLVESTVWEVTVMCLIALNTLVLMIEFYDQPKSYERIINEINHIFTFVFTFEFLIKLFAFGKNYFKDGWNDFDLLIVIGSIMDFMIKKVLPPGSIKFDPSIFRLFRAARLIKLLRRSRSLRILLWTFLQSFKALPYVGMLFSLLFFVYGIIGMQIFSLISIENNEEPWAQISKNNNFRSYVAATQVLFRIATGENWPNIMLACTSNAACDPHLPAVQEGQLTCGSDIAYFYFMSFVFLSSFLMLNLFIAVIMDNFAFLTEDSSIIGPHHLDEFVTVWSDFDPSASGRIKHTELCELLRRMVPPVGLGARCPKIIAYKRLVAMNMTLYRDGTVDFTGTFFALVRTALGIYTARANIRSNELALKSLLKETWPNISKRTLNLVISRAPRSVNHMTIGKIYGAKLIWESYKQRKKLVQNIPVELNPRSRKISAFQKMGLLLSNSDTKPTNSPTQKADSNSTLKEPKSRKISKSIKQKEQNQKHQSPAKSALLSSPQKTPSIGRDRGEIALALRSGQSPYKLYNLDETQEREEWC